MASVLPLSPQAFWGPCHLGFPGRAHRQLLERVEEALEDLGQWAMPVEKKDLKLSQQATSGWQCEAMNIVTRRKGYRSHKKRLAGAPTGQVTTCICNSHIHIYIHIIISLRNLVYKNKNSITSVPSTLTLLPWAAARQRSRTLV